MSINLDKNTYSIEERQFIAEMLLNVDGKVSCHGCRVSLRSIEAQERGSFPERHAYYLLFTGSDGKTTQLSCAELHEATDYAVGLVRHDDRRCHAERFAAEQKVTEGRRQALGEQLVDPESRHAIDDRGNRYSLSEGVNANGETVFTLSISNSNSENARTITVPSLEEAVEAAQSVAVFEHHISTITDNNRKFGLTKEEYALGDEKERGMADGAFGDIYRFSVDPNHPNEPEAYLNIERQPAHFAVVDTLDSGEILIAKLSTDPKEPYGELLTVTPNENGRYAVTNREPHRASDLYIKAAAYEQNAFARRAIAAMEAEVDLSDPKHPVHNTDRALQAFGGDAFTATTPPARIALGVPDKPVQPIQFPMVVFEIPPFHRATDGKILGVKQTIITQDAQGKPKALSRLMTHAQALSDLHDLTLALDCGKRLHDRTFDGHTEKGLLNDYVEKVFDRALNRHDIEKDHPNHLNATLQEIELKNRKDNITKQKEKNKEDNIYNKILDAIGLTVNLEKNQELSKVIADLTSKINSCDRDKRQTVLKIDESFSKPVAKLLHDLDKAKANEKETAEIPLSAVKDPPYAKGHGGNEKITR